MQPTERLASRRGFVCTAAEKAEGIDVHMKILRSLIVSVPAVLLAAGLLAGCTAHTQQTPTPGGTSTGDAQRDAVLTFDSFDGGGPEYTLTVGDPAIVSFTSERRYRDADHDEIDGAGYSIVFTLTGLQAGETTATVSARSPIAENYDAVYRVCVDEALRVSVERLPDAPLDDTVLEAEPEPAP